MERGVDLNLGMPITGTRWSLPIILAARYSVIEILELLLDSGVMPEVADSDGSTILHAALSNPSSRDGSTLRNVDVACFRVLERHGILVAKREKHDRTIKGTRV